MCVCVCAFQTVDMEEIDARIDSMRWVSSLQQKSANKEMCSFSFACFTYMFLYFIYVMVHSGTHFYQIILLLIDSNLI